MAEAALLAGLIQAPSRYDPIRNLDAAHRRAAVVIDAMVETGAINASAAEKAKTEPSMALGTNEVNLLHSLVGGRSGGK